MYPYFWPIAAVLLITVGAFVLGRSTAPAMSTNPKPSMSIEAQTITLGSYTSITGASFHNTTIVIPRNAEFLGIRFQGNFFDRQSNLMDETGTTYFKDNTTLCGTPSKAEIEGE